MLYKKTHNDWLFFLLVLLVYTTACEKEYSYEGGAIPPPVIVPVDSIQPADSTHVDPGELPTCPFCVNTGDIPVSSWSFKTGNSLLCGKVDTAIILSLERNTFTFFGPATCGTDTGLIFTVSLNPNSLDRNIENIAASNTVFYYYHTNEPYILISAANQPFMLTITTYNQSTKIATGTFSGQGYRQDGRAVNVTDGKFKIKLQ